MKLYVSHPVFPVPDIVKTVQYLHKTDYHNQEFVIEDIDGRWIYFGIKED